MLLRSRRVDALGRAVAALLVVALSSAFGVVALVAPAGAAGDPCELIDEASVGRLLGPTSDSASLTIGSFDACRVEVGGLTIDLIDGSGVAGEYEAQLASHGDDHQVVEDYVDGAFFGWGVGDAFDFAARLGDQVTILRVTGTDAGRDFDAADPTANAPDGDVSGTEIGSALWVLMTEAFANGEGVAVPTTDDLSGLWRTTDVTACAPNRDLTVRISRFTAEDDTLRAVKVAGDSCIDDGDVDFEGTTANLTGSGVSFGSTGSGSPANGSAYRLAVDSPTSITLSGAAGALQYTLQYERLSWPGLTNLVTSSLLGIPTPSEAFTAKNVALTGVVSFVLLLLVVFPTTLFNSALDANLDHYRELVDRFVTRVRSLGRRRPTQSDPTAPPPKPAIWRTRKGVVLYVLLAGLLFSLMQPSWGPNSATLISLIGFVGGVAISSLLGVTATVIYLLFSHRNGRGRAVVEPSTLALASVFVLASRVVGFVPGYMYGVLVGWTSAHEQDEFDRGRIVAFGSAITLLAAVVAWLLIPLGRDLAGTDPNVLEAIPLGILGGVFVSSVESLTIGLIPLHFLPGHTLRAHSRKAWSVLWAGGGIMFVLVLLRPGLIGGASRNVMGTCILVAVSSTIAIAFWAYERGRASGPSAPPVPSAASVPAAGTPPPIPPQYLPPQQLPAPHQPK